MTPARRNPVPPQMPPPIAAPRRRQNPVKRVWIRLKYKYEDRLGTILAAVLVIMLILLLLALRNPEFWNIILK